jgi:hypothetical protein
MSRYTLQAVLICSAVLVAVAAPLARQATTPPPHQNQTPDKAKPQSDMMAKCMAMKAQQEKMMAEVQAADQRLDGLVAKLNAASGQAKVDATAAAVTEIVAQRKAMRESMMTMQHGMMGHMADHVQAGPESMAMCPMMKEMGGAKR